MHKLKTRPTQSGYSVQHGSNVQMQQLDGGAPRLGIFTKKASHSVNVQFVVDKAGYQYLCAFYRVWLRNPSQPFLADLVIDGEAPLQQYQCFFVPGSFQLSSKNGQAHTVVAQLIVPALNTDDDLDDLLVSIGDADGSVADLVNPLQQIANHDLPDALDGIGG